MTEYLNRLQRWCHIHWNLFAVLWRNNHSTHQAFTILYPKNLSTLNHLGTYSGRQLACSCGKTFGEIRYDER